MTWAAIGLMLFVATGAYAILPGTGYLVAGLVTIGLLAQPRVRERATDFVPPQAIVGALLFNATFLGLGLWQSLPLRDYLVHVFSLLMFLLAHGAMSVALQRGEDSAAHRVLVVSTAGLLTLLAGQLLQSAALLPHVDPPAGSFLVSLVVRPGGFLNANMTAAIALILLYVSGVHRRASPSRWHLIVALLAILVIVLTQSRAALLAALPLGLYVMRRHPLRVAAGLASLAGALWLAGAFDQGGMLHDIVDRFASRFAGDESSDERAWILRLALASIDRAPVLGSGYQSLTNIYGAGSHNMIVEALASFGLLGASLLILAGCLMLWPASLLFIVVCVLPSFMFSHNYFDSAPLQAALGMALGAERLQSHRARLLRSAGRLAQSAEPAKAAGPSA